MFTPIPSVSKANCLAGDEHGAHRFHGFISTQRRKDAKAQREFLSCRLRAFAVLSPKIVTFCEDFPDCKLQVADCKSLVPGRTNPQCLVPNIIFGCSVSRAMPLR
jgi:hypothetical protein